MNVADIERQWAERAARYLKAELKRADLTYKELAARLNAKGWEETEASITNKLARATVSAHLFLASLEAIGKDQVLISDV